MSSSFTNLYTDNIIQIIGTSAHNSRNSRRIQQQASSAQASAATTHSSCNNQWPTSCALSCTPTTFSATRKFQHEDSSIVRVTAAHYCAGTFLRQPSKLLALNFLAPVCRQKTSTASLTCWNSWMMSAYMHASASNRTASKFCLAGNVHCLQQHRNAS
jgi:hypothetical protein